MEGSNGSFLEQARAARERLAKPKVKEADIPGYKGILKARYGVLPYKKTREFIDEASAHGLGADHDLYMAAETLLECCQTLLRKEGDEWVEWTDNGNPVRYDNTLANALSLDMPVNPQPRDVVYELFGGLTNASAQRALVGHYFELIAWMDGEDEEISEELVGNSKSAE